MAKTLYEKLFDAHVVYEAENETPLLYIDRHLVHEVTSPQAFDGLRAHGRPVRQPGKTFATMDHNVSTQTKDINGIATRIDHGLIVTRGIDPAAYSVLGDFIC